MSLSNVRLSPNHQRSNEPQMNTKTSKLIAVREELGDCRRCPLHTTRKNIVFGVGDPHAALMFIGEGPGADEDEQGEPFVGAAGQMLNRMIVSIGWDRQSVYIANIVKCRPTDEDGGNRQGSPEEVSECFPFLEKQIRSISPLVIMTLGNLATKTLLGIEEGITRVRGNWKSWDGIPVMPTFHPSNLLHDPGNKRFVRRDLRSVVARLAAMGVAGPLGVKL